MATPEKLPCTLTGELRSFPTVEVVTLLHHQKKSGHLDVTSQGAHRSLFFQEGEVVFASSTAKTDRLGECLVRLGRITQDKLDQAAKTLKPGVKLGKILVEQKTLTPGQLWTGVKNQVEEIFHSVLRHNEGAFFFYEGASVIEGPVRLSKSVRSLILDAVRQRDELKIFAQQVINKGTVFLPLDRPVDLKLTDVEENVLGLIDGVRTVRDVLLQSSSTALVTLKVLSNLMMARVIMPKDLLGGWVLPQQEGSAQDVAPPSESTEKARWVQQYNRVFHEVHSTLADFGYSVTGDVLEYFQDMQSPYLLFWRGLVWLPEGGLDSQKLLANLSHLKADQQLGSLAQALEDLLLFVLFKVQSFLPKEVYDALLAVVREIQETKQ